MADIGQTLREARMHARIDITEVESRTKIRARYLRALENEEWDLLPGPVYIKSFMRTYADYLGLDSRLLVDEFKRLYEGPSEHELRSPSGLRRERERERERSARPARGPLLPPWAIVGGVLVAVVVALYLIGSGTGGGGTTPAGSHTASRTHRRHVTTTTTPIKHVKPKPKLAKVKLVATGDVWICAENQAGKLLIPGTTYLPGQTVPTLRGRQVLLTLGNANVTMTADGKPYSLAATATATGLKVTATGVTVLQPGTGPTCAAG